MPRSSSSSTTNMPSSSPSSMPSSSLYRSAVHVGKSERSLENEEDHVQDDDLYTSNGGAGGGSRAAATNPFLSNLYPYQQETRTPNKRIERASFSQVESVIGHHHTHVTTTTRSTRSTGLQKNNSNSSILEMEDEEEDNNNNDEKNQFIRGTHFEITNGGSGTTTTTTTNGHSHTHRPFPNATAAQSKSIATINLHDINDSDDDDDDSNDDDDDVYITTSPLLQSILAKVVPTPPSPLLTFLLILYALAITASWAYLLFRSIETPPFHTIQADVELIQDYKETIQELKEEVGRLKIVNERMEEGMEMVLGDKDVLLDKVVKLQNKTNWLELQCNNKTHAK